MDTAGTTTSFSLVWYLQDKLINQFMFLYSLLHSLSELPELVLAPAVAHAELVVEGLGVRLGQADRADVGLQAELGVEEEQGEVVMVVAGVQAGMFLQGGQQ